MKKKHILINAFFWLIIGMTASLLSHYIIELLYYNYNFPHVFNTIFNVRFELFLLGSLILFVFYILFSSISGSSIIGALLLVTLSWGIGIATQYKSHFRAEPIYPNELYMMKELPFLLEMIGKKRSLMIVLTIILIVGIIFLLDKYIIKPRKEYFYKESLSWGRIIGIGLSGLMLYYIARFNYPNNKVKEIYETHAHWVRYNQTKNYSENGFIAGFLSNLDAPPITKPNNYTKKELEKLVSKYQNKASEINQERSNSDIDTNIIFVMNESFSDPLNLDGLEFNKDPLPYYRDFIQGTLSGNLVAPSVGGGTATNEFQVLTSFSMKPFDPHLTSPYIQLTSRIDNFPTVVARVKKFDFQTTAIHPYTPTFYRRSDVYKSMKFDEFFHQENMTHKEKIADSHRYISDLSAYKEVFQVMEDSSKKDFVHLVTMQNHMPFANKYESVNYEVVGSGNDSEANAYFEDLEHSDSSLKFLIDKITDFDEPILLVFWGDHLPGFYQGDILRSNSTTKMRETPFVFYSNTIDLKGEKESISPIYFINYIGEILDLKITPYEALLLELEEKLPVLEDGMYYDNLMQAWKNSRTDLSDEAKEVLSDYTLLMYDVTTGNQYLDTLGFFEYYE